MTTASIDMGRITFFEDRNFQGRSYECSSDCADIHLHLNRCSSCRVDSGCFVVYDRHNFAGNQVFLRRGEYSDVQRIGSIMGMVGMAVMDTIRSCRIIPMHRGQFRMRIYERENFGGRMQELVDDCESVQDALDLSDCLSCQVTDGHWLAFEQVHFRGRMTYLRPGEYRNLRDPAVSGVMKVSSVRRITDSC
ncbi:gamma-crystallin M3-like [Sphaeramia orbicularis]|uniref:gamma-crystallin M3-like n=1 Tax=Sphaeramia orbicularis TaxID=375764 RepID=UPI0011809965|nr:gamma-crystallin M3-like [Sphaeramia orbicularis]